MSLRQATLRFRDGWRKCSTSPRELWAGEGPWGICGHILLSLHLCPSQHCEVVDGFTNTDAYHITSPCPDGSGAAAFVLTFSVIDRCMTHLLAKAGVQPQQVGYINAHATSTQIGDRAEMQAIHSVFGKVSSLPYVSSTKVRIHKTIESRELLAIFWEQRAH